MGGRSSPHGIIWTVEPVFCVEVVNRHGLGVVPTYDLKT